MTTWDDIDEPVLRFIGAQGSSMPPAWAWKLELRPTVASTEVGGLDERQIDEAMLRLQSAGLVDARQRSETIAYAMWTRPRVTALGSMVLGVWPDLDHVDMVATLQTSLAALAEHEAEPARQIALRRAAGFVGSLSEGIALKIIAGATGGLGKGTG